jgi:serine/threonine protein kinase
MYQKILYADLVFPETLSPDAKDLIGKLLDRDPKQRLGHGPEDAEPIKGTASPPDGWMTQS